MKRSVLVIFTVVLTIFFTYNLFAQDNSSAQVNRDKSTRMKGIGQMRGMGPMMDRGQRGFEGMGLMFIKSAIAEKIGLSDDQKKKIDDIVTNHRKDMVTKRAEIELAQIDLDKLIKEDNPDMKLVKEQIQKLSNLKADREFAQIKARNDIKNILTKEQQNKITELMKENRDQIKEKVRQNEEKRPQRMGNNPKRIDE
jgi:Spy/CpxP family protein refolding chaperone